MTSFKVKSEQGKLVVGRCEEGDRKQEQNRAAAAESRGTTGGKTVDKVVTGGGETRRGLLDWGEEE
ncbi:hypothetical protein BDFG_07091 [Blastomyces dermatitidis ATCC 26199]|nr:hypothetical protein BDFG_07091 [Blastomyces dermatitidis ATCC 26199]